MGGRGGLPPDYHMGGGGGGARHLDLGRHEMEGMDPYLQDAVRARLAG